jgi:hypothetical protein
MRQINASIKDYSVTLGSSSLVQSSKQIPNYGSVQGLSFALTVALAGATASVTNTVRVDTVIDHLTIETNKGKTIMDITGADLTVINDVLNPIGHRVTAPEVTTDSSGDATENYNLFLPISIDAMDMPAIIKTTFAPASVLQDTNLTSSGTVTVTWKVRASYSTGSAKTVFIKASNPPVQSGENSFAPYLPQGMEVQSIVVKFTDTSSSSDSDLDYITLMSQGAALLLQSPAYDFSNDDQALMISGHLFGEFILRVPIFVVDSTTILNVNLNTSTTCRVYSFATKPQKNTSGS